MLAVRIHGQRVRVAVLRREVEAAKQGGAFANVVGENDDRKPRILFGHFLQLLGGAVGAAINDHPNGIPETARRAYRLVDLGSRVVAGDEDEMGA